MPAITLMNINEIERVLAAEPRNVRALILKADHLANAGDARSASSYYQIGRASCRERV